ncbi:MAG: tripartite tricarboxylate transporter substrate binding protein [Betaproteobacteria bacterium]|nr:tripartite tricarboxylate transporter substrate binding protein [Betaproteobacteria bacterium]
MSRLDAGIASGLITIFSLLHAAPLAAQSYPAKAIHIFVTIGPGAAADVLTRIVGEELGKRLGQPVIIENRAGAGGNIAGEAVARSAPDGHALLMASSSTHGANASIYPNMPFDPIKDFAPIVLVAGNPNVLVVPPALGVNTLAELVALAKRKPGELSYASGGTGTSMHISGEVLMQLAGVKLLHVPYKSTPAAINAALAGEVSMTFASVPTALAQVKAGKLRALGLTSEKPLALLPDMPTIASQGLAGYDVSAWFGLAAPAGTPEAIVNRINAETRALLQVPALREKLFALGMEPLGSTPAEFATFIRSEIKRLGEVVKASGAKLN